MDSLFENIQISISSEVKVIVRHDFRKSVEILLSVVPKEDLYGLARIQIVAQGNNKKFPDARGLYDGFNDPSNRTIVLCVRYIFPKKKKWLFNTFAFIPRVYIGYVLYHEIGHHYHNMHHGIKKKEWESFANDYRRKYFIKWLCASKLYKIFRWLIYPFKRLIYEKWYIKKYASKNRR